MKWHEESSRLLARFEVGEKLPAGLVDLATRMGLVSGYLTGIGGVKDVVLGYYDLQQRKYISIPVDGMVELVSLIGNVSIVQGNPFWHLHATVADRNGTVTGGHLMSLEVAITVECWIEKCERMITRSKDDFSGLNLLNL